MILADFNRMKYHNLLFDTISINVFPCKLAAYDMHLFYLISQ